MLEKINPKIAEALGLDPNKSYPVYHDNNSKQVIEIDMFEKTRNLTKAKHIKNFQNFKKFSRNKFIYNIKTSKSEKFCRHDTNLIKHPSN